MRPHKKPRSQKTTKKPAPKRRRPEAAPPQTAEPLESVLSQAPIIIFGLDPKGVFTFSTGRGLAALGLAPGEVVGQSSLEMYRENPKVLADLRRALKGEDFNSTAQVGELWYETFYHPLLTATGGLKGIVALSLDVTARRRVESELIQSERRFRTVIDTMQEGFYLTDREGVRLFVNKALARIYGVGKPADLIGKSFFDRVHPDQRETIRARFQEAMRTGVFPKRVEITFLREDGGTSFMELDPSPVYEEGRLVGASGVARDISERKRAEAERARLLAFEKAARLDAEAASRAKDEFLAIVSHELRTPITAILGWNWLLRSGELNVMERERALEVIERNMQMQKQIIEDLLDISSLARGQVVIKKQFIDLGSVVADASAAFKAPAAAKSLRLTCKPTLGLLVEGDPQRLRQVFWNLLSNALKFTPEGGTVTIHIRSEQSQAVVCVEDSGPGISPEFYPHLFDTFRQQEDSLTREHRGLGLGLAIVKHLVALHGGSVSVAPPAPGKGARITVALPLAACRPGAAAQAAPEDQDEALPRFPGILKGIRVLVVDDDNDTRSMLVSVLEHCGAEAQGAGSAETALAALSRDKPDVLISDIAMPGEDGHALIERIRALPAGAGGQVPAAALTAYATAEDRTRALRAGFQIYLPKPVDPAELITVVRTLAKRTQAPA